MTVTVQNVTRDHRVKGASIDFLTRSQKTRKLKEEEVKISLVQVSYTKACSATRPREVWHSPFGELCYCARFAPTWQVSTSWVMQPPRSPVSREPLRHHKAANFYEASMSKSGTRPDELVIVARP